MTGSYNHIKGAATLCTRMGAGKPTFITLLKAAGHRMAVVGK